MPIPEAQRLRNAAWHAANPERTREIVRKSKLKTKYGLSPEQYAALSDRQGGVCAGCGRPPEGMALCVDHDHACCPGTRSCGECVRGLLCHECNRGLGALRDDPNTLRNLIAYLAPRS